MTLGHIFPLRAKRGGTLVRTGHTEGSVDLLRLSGLTPAAVICEIMNDDGTMARMPDLCALPSSTTCWCSALRTSSNIVCRRNRWSKKSKHSSLHRR